MEVDREVEPGFTPDEQQPSAPYGAFAASQENRATPKAGLHAKSGAPPVFANTRALGELDETAATTQFRKSREPC
jgi:hypothetical protein